MTNTPARSIFLQQKKGICEQNNNLTRCFETGGRKPRCNRSFQRRRFSFAEGGIRCRAGTEGPGHNWCL